MVSSSLSVGLLGFCLFSITSKTSSESLSLFFDSIGSDSDTSFL